ncbi:hypothetical protein [Marisediminicola senii]|uniref:hypothetical protein n=1 Tax=Marisediminicola senii TaxID=2711233 RepID=UPI0013EBA995|nr:hypothetical protein [Marisediminicola senii]
MMRAVRPVAALLGVMAMGGMAGCTAFGGDEPAPSSSASPESSPAAVESSELSRQILDAAAAADGDLPVLGSQTIEVDSFNFDDEVIDVTVAVHRIERRADSTMVTLSMSSPSEGAALDGAVFADGAAGTFFDRIAIEDPEGGVRYLGLSWRREVNSELSPPADSPLNSCVCAYRQNLTLGNEPVFMDALYAPLPPDLSTVSVTAPGGLSIPGIDVSESPE